MRVYMLACWHVLTHTYKQVFHHKDAGGLVTPFDGLKHGIINMGNGILFTHEFLRQYLQQASRNQMTMKGFFDSRVQDWRDDYSLTDGTPMCVPWCLYACPEFKFVCVCVFCP